MSIVYIISAPSGSGKSTLVSEILKLVPEFEVFDFLHHSPAAGE